MGQLPPLLTEQEVRSPLVWLLEYLFTEGLDGRNAHLAEAFSAPEAGSPATSPNNARDAAACGVRAGVSR